jgi:hypothetical protein
MANSSQGLSGLTNTKSNTSNQSVLLSTSVKLNKNIGQTNPPKLPPISTIALCNLGNLPPMSATTYLAGDG